jgi:capsular exopolysaccharide synthesis family protein
MTTRYVVDELRRLSDDKQSGALELTGAQGERVVVYLVEGLIDAVSSNISSRRLGEYLSRVKTLTPKEMDSAASYAVKHSLAIGEAFVARNLALPPDVAAAVRSQSVELIDLAIREGYAVGSFNPRLQAFQIPGRTGFAVVEIEISRQESDPFDGPDDVRLRIVHGAHLSGYSWIPEELGVLSALVEPKSIRDLTADLRLDERLLRKILGVLDRLGVVEIDGRAPDVRGPDGRVLVERERGEGVAAEGPNRSDVRSGALVRTRDFPFESLIPTATSFGLDERSMVAREVSGFTAEQFKNLKVQLADHETASRKVFTVSSPEARDGKSFVSLNLALSYAMDPDRRVLIIDCDLRSPSVGRYLGLPEEPGLLQCLEDSRLSPFCFLRKVEGLYLMTAGGMTQRPIEVLSMGKMREVLDRFRGVFDTIILDAPPYSPIADARIVTGLSDGLIIVLRRGKTGYSAADKAFKAVDRKKLVGVVLNDVKPMLFNSYAYPKYGYDYGSSATLTILPHEDRSRSRSYLE